MAYNDLVLLLLLMLLMLLMLMLLYPGGVRPTDKYEKYLLSCWLTKLTLF